MDLVRSPPHLVALADDNSTSQTGPKLHLGCGLNTPSGWENVDGSWNARLAKWPRFRAGLARVGILSKEQAQVPWSPSVQVYNINKGLPYANQTHSAVYCSHLLEHLYLEQQQGLLREIFRILKPGGVFRAVVPDLKPIIQEYLDGVSDDRADRLNARLGMHEAHEPKGRFWLRVYRRANDLHSHKWMYDAQSLAFYFKKAGFTEVEEKPVHESRISGIEKIEDPSRVRDGQGVCIEGIRPHTKC